MLQNVKLLVLLKATVAYCSPRAIEARARDRDQRKLARELDELQAMRRYCNDREPVLLAQVHKLQRREVEASLVRAATGAERWTAPSARRVDDRNPWIVPDLFRARGLL